jgi:hypothetical protein
MKKPSLARALVIAGFLPWAVPDIQRVYYFLLERKLSFDLFAAWLRKRKEEVLDPERKLPLLFWANEYLKWQSADQESLQQIDNG